MIKKNIILCMLALCTISPLFSQQRVREHRVLAKGWKFIKGDFQGAAAVAFDDSRWQEVIIPHDWAIYGPFEREYDLQTVAVTQNLEYIESLKTGRTGGLPYIGVGWYRTMFSVGDICKTKKRVTLQFDGAMSEAQVYVNGKEVCFWPYGYNAFHCDVTAFVHTDGKENVLAVRLENRPQSSRWYPGAGLYRNVHLIVTNEVHVPVWGTYITTPVVSEKYATVNLKTKLCCNNKEKVRIVTEIRDKSGNFSAKNEKVQEISGNNSIEQDFTIDNPQLWSPESPNLYVAISKIFIKDELVDEYITRFGVRKVEVVAGKGFFLNGQFRKFRGVCNHHDLGPLGAAVNRAALRRQLVLLKDMGCDAIRTSHNMPAPELVELCDEMGFMMMIESFDEWDVAKCDNGYYRYFDEWGEKDMVNMLHHFRNNPCVVMWSIGNEVPTQCADEGYKVAKFLQDICHREDPTRPVTCGMDRVNCVLGNGFAALLDVPGFNYRTQYYPEGYGKLPQKFLLGSETASVVSSRGVYRFPAEKRANAIYADHQSSSYDLEYCEWSNIPDVDFALAEDYPWTMGQFVWTGFDYLGEPTPYDIDAWPNHSSMFGIIDLASIPKDRYWLYRSVWNTVDTTLHILPHWTWLGREGEVIPVFVYTSYPSAELFVNGVSQGVRKKSIKSPEHRYRLMWMDVVYKPGEVKVVAYDSTGNACAEKIIRTAGVPHHLALLPDRRTIAADGTDLAYITVKMLDKDGNLCPHDNRLISFTVSGNGIFRAAANGDPTCLDLFHLPQMHLFNGQLTVLVQSLEQEGALMLEAAAAGVQRGKIQIKVANF
jgi:beta-galactosidase